MPSRDSGVVCEDCGMELPERCVTWRKITAASRFNPAEFVPVMKLPCPKCDYFGRVFN